MKKMLLLLLLFVALPALAQASHSVSLAWSTTGEPTGVNYHVYRAPCNGTVTAGVCSSEGAFTVIGSPVGASYVDSTVVAGSSYSYYVTAFCTASCPPGTSGESAPSGHVAGTIPNNQPPPPGTPSITIAVLNGLILGEGEILG